MAIAKGKNEMQASIDDTAAALITLTNEMEAYYNQRRRDLEAQLEKIREKNQNEDSEIIQSIISSSDFRWIYDEMHQETLEMLVCKVYSFAEKHMGEMLKRIHLKEKQAKELGQGQGVSDMETYYMAIQKRFGISESISEKWIGYKDFHRLRKDIVHHHDNEKKDVSANYILSNINQVKELLLYVEEVSRSNSQ